MTDRSDVALYAPTQFQDLDADPGRVLAEVRVDVGQYPGDNVVVMPLWSDEEAAKKPGEALPRAWVWRYCGDRGKALLSSAEHMDRAACVREAFRVTKADEVTVLGYAYRPLMICRDTGSHDR